MLKRPSVRDKKHFLLLPFLAFLVGFPSVGQAAGRKPPSSESQSNDQDGLWIRNGVKKKMDFHVISEKEFLSVSNLARLSQSQLRWQSVTEQACLSRVDSLMCFNWDRNEVYKNGHPLKNRSHLVFRDNQLYVPVKFATSEDFQSFSQTKIDYDEKTRVLTQNSPVTLHFPPIQNLGDRYRIHVELEEETPYKILSKGKKKIWIRFTRGRFPKSQIFEGDRIVKEVKIIQRRRSADLVIKLGRDAGEAQISFDRNERKIVIDVPSGPGASLKAFAAAPAVPTPTSKSKGASRKPVKPIADKSIRTIVIDPGHGGKDSGAIGTRRTLEKDINLKVAKALAQKLKKQKNIRVILTRDKDEYLTLNQRTNMALQARADLFVSIHCNSSISSSASGFEVYILSPEASDEAAAAVARFENSVVQLEEKKGEPSAKLTNILASMAVYDFINESSECAAHLCRGVKKESPVNKTDVREANFHVLRLAQMPGVLIELEYLSNPVAELKLRSSRYRSQVVKGLARGIETYDQMDRKRDQSRTVQKKTEGK